MYIRYNLSKEARDNMEIIKSKQYGNARVTNGYILSKMLENYETILAGVDVEEIYINYKCSEASTVIVSNVNMTSRALENIVKLRALFEQKFGVRLFAAQVLEFLILCSLADRNEGGQEITDQELLQAILGFAHDLAMSKELGKVKNEIADCVLRNGLHRKEKV